MIRIILILLILCLCGLAGYAVNLLPPQRVYVFAAGYYLETSLIVWLILSLIASGIVFYCLRMLCILWHSPQILSRSSRYCKQTEGSKRYCQCRIERGKTIHVCFVFHNYLPDKNT